jgi:hypothetical protein
MYNPALCTLLFSFNVASVDLQARDFLNEVALDSETTAAVKALTDRIGNFLLSADSEKSHKACTMVLFNCIYMQLCS